MRDAVFCLKLTLLHGAPTMLLLELPAALMCHLSAPKVGRMVRLELLELLDVDVCEEKNCCQCAAASEQREVSTKRSTKLDNWGRMKHDLMAQGGACFIVSLERPPAVCRSSVLEVFAFFLVRALANCPV
jgi:hypothetical protein